MADVKDIVKSEATYTVELSQIEMDFIVSASVALGTQGFIIENSLGKYKANPDSKVAATRMATALERFRDKNIFERVEDKEKNDG